MERAEATAEGGGRTDGIEEGAACEGRRRNISKDVAAEVANGGGGECWGFLHRRWRQFVGGHDAAQKMVED